MKTELRDSPPLYAVNRIHLKCGHQVKKGGQCVRGIYWCGHCQDHIYRSETQVFHTPKPKP